MTVLCQLEKKTINHNHKGRNFQFGTKKQISLFAI